MVERACRRFLNWIPCRFELFDEGTQKCLLSVSSGWLNPSEFFKNVALSGLQRRSNDGSARAEEEADVIRVSSPLEPDAGSWMRIHASATRSLRMKVAESKTWQNSDAIGRTFLPVFDLLSGSSLRYFDQLSSDHQRVGLFPDGSFSAEPNCTERLSWRGFLLSSGDLNRREYGGRADPASCSLQIDVRSGAKIAVARDRFSEGPHGIGQIQHQACVENVSEFLAENQGSLFHLLNCATAQAAGAPQCAYKGDELWPIITNERRSAGLRFAPPEGNIDIHWAGSSGWINRCVARVDKQVIPALAHLGGHLGSRPISVPLDFCGGELLFVSTGNFGLVPALRRSAFGSLQIQFPDSFADVMALVTPLGTMTNDDWRHLALRSDGASSSYHRTSETLRLSELELACTSQGEALTFFIKRVSYSADWWSSVLEQIGSELLQAACCALGRRDHANILYASGQDDARILHIARDRVSSFSFRGLQTTMCTEVGTVTIPSEKIISFQTVD